MSDEISKQNYGGLSGDYVFAQAQWLKEIAYQLAVMNERAQPVITHHCMLPAGVGTKCMCPGCGRTYKCDNVGDQWEPVD